MTEAQLWNRLERKGYDEDEVRAAVERCRSTGLLDDRLFAQLYIAGLRKSVGNARLVAELVRKGIDKDIAREAVGESERDETVRCEAAIEKMLRTKPQTSYPTAARALERYGFPTPLIYRSLRTHAARFGPLAGIELDLL